MSSSLWERNDVNRFNSLSVGEFRPTRSIFPASQTGRHLFDKILGLIEVLVGSWVLERYAKHVDIVVLD